MNTPENSQLGKSASYIDHFDASLLFPIPRAGKRGEIGITGETPFLGADMWTAFELSWLNLRGKPQVALAHITVPCETPNIIESKSFKLYLNSFNNTRFADADAVRARLRADLSEAAWREPARSGAAPASIGVRVLLPELFDREPVYELEGLSLDRLDVECTHYTPAPELLKVLPNEAPVSEVLVSNLLNEFHEQCVERIFMDIWRRTQPLKLAVYARYTRRGGLDINPFRTSYPQSLPANTRTARQ